MRFVGKVFVWCYGFATSSITVDDLRRLACLTQQRDSELSTGTVSSIDATMSGVGAAA
jgi:hypothetical protein